MGEGAAVGVPMRAIGGECVRRGATVDSVMRCPAARVEASPGGDVAWGVGRPPMDGDPMGESTLKMMKRIGVLTSGGDSPGMNAAVRAVVRTATSHGMEVAAYLDGYTGMVENRIRWLDDRSVGNVIQLGGTFIGTSRSEAFMRPDVRAEVAGRMRDTEIDGLVVIGGDGSFRGALALEQEHGIKIAGLPGTIDNDVWGTDDTIGFDTAVNTALYAIDNLRDTGESTGTMFFVEVMGRTSAAIAAHVSLAGGAMGVVVPGEIGEIPRLIDRLMYSIPSGKRSHIIVVAEGDELGGAFEVSRRVAEHIDRKSRVVVLGHIQRGGRPTARDRMIASVSGALAVDALAAGRSGIMVGIQGGHACEVSLREVVEKMHPAPPLHIAALAERLAGNKPT